MYFGPHLFYGKPMIFKQWTPKFYFHKVELKVVPIWVKLPNLPLNRWSDNFVSRIGSVLGIPIYVDECKTRVLRVSFSRILVEMDVTKAIPQEVQVEDLSGRKFAQKVVYNWLPPLCKSCQMVGHNCDTKRKALVKVTQKWVPKVTVPSNKGKKNDAPVGLLELEDDNGVKDQKEEDNTISNDGAPSKTVDLSSTGDPPLVVDRDGQGQGLGRVQLDPRPGP